MERTKHEPSLLGGGAAASSGQSPRPGEPAFNRPATAPGRPITPPPPFPPAKPNGSNRLPFGAQVPMGNAILLAFSFLLIANHIGRPFEHMLVGLRIPAAICGLAIIAAVFGGLSALKTKIGLALVAFVGWMMIIMPLSTWKGGSFPYVMDFWKLWVVFFMVLACAPKSMGQLKFLGALTAVAAIFNILIAGQFNNEGRFAMEGTYGNPDDAAILAGFAIPFWVFTISRFRPFVAVPLAIAGTVFLLRIMILTGTRSVLISILCMGVLWLMRTTASYRVFTILVASLAGVGIIATTPASVVERLSTTFDAFFSTSHAQAYDEAAQSAAERHSLLKDGILTTLTHPIWGVGPGQFGQYRWSTLGSPEKRKTWFKTHNTYIELSANNGIPGVVLYLFLIWSILKSIRRLRGMTRTSQPGSNLATAFQFATCLESALVFFGVTALFMTVEAHPYLFLIAGLTVAADRLVQFEHSRAPAAASALRAYRTPWAPSAVRKEVTH